MKEPIFRILLKEDLPIRLALTDSEIFILSRESKKNRQKGNVDTDKFRRELYNILEKCQEILLALTDSEIFIRPRESKKNRQINNTTGQESKINVEYNFTDKDRRELYGILEGCQELLNSATIARLLTTSLSPTERLAFKGQTDDVRIYLREVIDYVYDVGKLDKLIEEAESLIYKALAKDELNQLKQRCKKKPFKPPRSLLP